MTFILLQTPQQDSNIFSLSGPFHGPGHPCFLAGSQWESDMIWVERPLCCWLARRGLQGSLKPREEHTGHCLPGPSVLLLFLPQKPAEGQACPFPRARAYHPHCFKKNFLALNLKLKLPLGTLLFCMFLPLLVAISPCCPSSFTVTLRRAQRTSAMPTFPPLSRTSVPKNQFLSLCPSEAKHSLIRIRP